MLYDPNRFGTDESWQASLDGTRVVFGVDSLHQVGALARELGMARVLLVTDPGLCASGHVDRAVASLEAASVDTVVYHEIESAPTTHHVGVGVERARAAEADGLIGLGGGSAMDCAKGINFLFTNGGRMEDYWGEGKATHPMLPSIGIPTTAGTGSEAQSFALITQPDTHVKMACGDRKARFRAVVLDPVLTGTLPTTEAAVTGIDAVSHALESYVTRRRNPFAQAFARSAWELLDAGYESVVGGAATLRERGQMMLGAHLAGAAIELSMLGAAHATANPLSARFGLVHGVAVGLMLPHTIRFNAPQVDRLYCELADGGAYELADRVEALLRAGGLPSRLRDVGVPEDALPELAGAASKQWTAGFNPRTAGESELRGLYESAW